MAIGFVVLFVAVMNAPNFLTYKIIEMRLNETCEIKDESVRYAPAYIPGVSDMAVQAYCLVSSVPLICSVSEWKTPTGVIQKSTWTNEQWYVASAIY